MSSEYFYPVYAPGSSPNLSHFQTAISFGRSPSLYPPRFPENIRRDDDDSTSFYDLLRSGIICTFEMCEQEESTAYLDLALHFPRWKNWKIFARTEFQRLLPVTIREIFLAETLDHDQYLTRLFRRFLYFNTGCLQWFRNMMEHFKYRLFAFFERVLFDEIDNKNDTVKKRNVFKYLKAYEVFQIDRFDLKMFDFLIQLCTDNLLDCELTVVVLRTLCDKDYKKRSVFYNIINETSLIALIRHAATMKFDFWGIWSGFGNLALELNFIHRFMDLGINQEYSRILLKFGFPYLANFTQFVVRCFFLEDLEDDENFRRRRYSRRYVLRTLKRSFNKANGNQKTRMMLIMDTFGNFYPESDIEDCVRTLVYLTRSLPDPYVTPSELYSTMKKLVLPEFLPNLKAITRKYSEAGIFENEYKTYSPRRLEHLCRVVIRKSLAINFKLLNGIEELNIPGLIKSYLELER